MAQSRWNIGIALQWIVKGFIINVTINTELLRLLRLAIPQTITGAVFDCRHLHDMFCDNIQYTSGGAAPLFCRGAPPLISCHWLLVPESRRGVPFPKYLIRKMAGCWFLFLKFFKALDRGSPVETAPLFPARAWQWPVFIPTVFTKIRRSVSNFGRGKTFNFPKNFQTKSQLYLYVIWLRLKSSFIIKTSALVHSRTNF